VSVTQVQRVTRPAGDPNPKDGRLGRTDSRSAPFLSCSCSCRLSIACAPPAPPCRVQRLFEYSESYM
jgi:hypothetical protein